MSEASIYSLESFTKKGVNKVALSAAKVAAAGALLVSPEAAASEMMEQQRAPVAYEEKVEAVADYFDTVKSVEYSLRLDAENASLQPVEIEDLDQTVQDSLEQLGHNTHGDREYYTLTTRTEEQDELAASRGVFEEGRVSGGDYLSMSTIASGSFEGYALNENGVIVGPIEVLHLRGEEEYDTASGETDVSLILGLPEDDARVSTYEIHAQVHNRLVADAYCEDDGQIVSGVSIVSNSGHYEGMLEPLVFDVVDGEPEPRSSLDE